MDNETIVNSIKALCKANGITIGQLEKSIGLSQGLVSKWKEKMPSLDKIIKIADYFQVSIDDVLGRELPLNEDTEGDDFTFSLMQMTENEEIEWKLIPSNEGQNINDISYEEAFELDYDDPENEIEIYKCEYDDSSIFLVVQYNLYQGTINNLDIQIYIRPDKRSIPVLQKENGKWYEELWTGIRKRFKGMPDEWKSHEVRKSIIRNKKNSNTFNGKEDIYYDSSIFSQNLSDDLREAIGQINAPEMKQLIAMLNSDSYQSLQKLLSNKELISAIQNIQKVSKFIHKDRRG